eukprot:CAMPEP_0203667906 /NCGR_PEP_ID=MMETSP0090-20130426/4649_1 /ASSEMBLY_ACC=CAM_ASM_001088 /TAXON_ID=426623 /ORGANISM="Chaetoceros affinis, Strain CCMP159" /LENGTH=45 /DNA_ID= /DNA_START= /DNA_END= /DNA_ORIENTATION=
MAWLMKELGAILGTLVIFGMLSGTVDVQACFSLILQVSVLALVVQ